MNNGLDYLLRIIAPNIKEIQNLFDVYQNECFDKRQPEFFCLELNGEAGELANLEKKSWKGRNIPIEKFEDEAADVLIALFNYANAKGIDLGQSIYNKLLIIENKRIDLESKGEKF